MVSVEINLDDGTSVRWELTEEDTTFDNLIVIIESALGRKPDAIKT